MAGDESTQDWTDPTLVGRYVGRVRRRADLSQRELAERVGMSQAAVGRIESGRTRPSLEVLGAIFAVGGLRLVVTDSQGRAVPPLPCDSVRDNAGRRFPAHLDVAAPDEVPRERQDSPRYDRLEARGWYHLRGERDRVRTKSPVVAERDHPTASELLVRRRLISGRQPRVDSPPRPEVVCECPDACFEGLCVEQCTCQCEPERGPLARRHEAWSTGPGPAARHRQEPTRVRTS